MSSPAQHEGTSYSKEWCGAGNYNPETEQGVRELIDRAYESCLWLKVGAAGQKLREGQSDYDSIRSCAAKIGNLLVESLSGMESGDGRVFMQVDNGTAHLVLVDGNRLEGRVITTERTIIVGGCTYSPHSLDDSLMVVAAAERIINPVVSVIHH